MMLRSSTVGILTFCSSMKDVRAHEESFSSIQAEPSDLLFTTHARGHHDIQTTSGQGYDQHTWHCFESLSPEDSCRVDILVYRL